MGRKSILMVVGSFREGSYNRQLASEIEAIIGDRARIDYLDYVDLPFMNEDFEPEATEAVRRVRAEVAAADAVWIVSPEYNHSIPGGLKNLLDWLSRSAATGNEHPLRVVPAAVSGVGMEGTAAHSIAEIAKVAEFIGFKLVDAPTVGVHVGRAEAAVGRLSLSDEEASAVRVQCDAMLSALGLL